MIDMNKSVKIECVIVNAPMNYSIYMLDAETDYVPFIFDNKNHSQTYSKEESERQRMREEMERKLAESEAILAWHNAGGFDMFGDGYEWTPERTDVLEAWYKAGGIKMFMPHSIA